jgi:hypothetical protein
MTSPHVLTDLTHATPAWLSAALARGGLHAAAQDVSELAFEPLGIGRSNLSGVWRLRLGPATGRLPSSMVLKFAPAGVSSLVRSWRLGRREILYYRHVGGTGPMRTPRCYFADGDDRSGDFTLLLEDLGAAAIADQGAGASFDQAKIAIEHLARHHAHFWQHEALSTYSDWLLLPNANRQAFSFYVKRGWRTCAKHYPDLPTSTEASLAALEQGYGAVLDRISAAPLTLLHGDYRLDNMFFQSDGWDEEFAVTDWQLVGRGRGPWDVAHFLVGSLTSATRATFAPELLRRYYSIVEPVARGYSFEDCVSDYDAGLLGSFTLAAALIDMQLRTSGAPAPVMEEWLRRAAVGAAESLEKLARP